MIPSSPEKERAYRAIVEARPRSAEFSRAYNIGRLILYYTREHYSVEELQAVLRELADDADALRQLDKPTPHPPEKEGAYLEVLAQRRRTGELKHILVLHRQRQCAADPAVSEDDLRALYAGGEPRVLEALAGNPRTPDDLLRRMAALRESPGARSVRTQALRALRHRQHLVRRETAARAQHRRTEDG
jgi:hypothetical protein